MNRYLLVRMYTYGDLSAISIVGFKRGNSPIKYKYKYNIWMVYSRIYSHEFWWYFTKSPDWYIITNVNKFYWCNLYLCRYSIHMDDSGDAEGNYTLLSMDPDRPPGLYPLAVLHKSAPVILLSFSNLLKS